MEKAKTINEELMCEAEALGINASLYYFLPIQRREALLCRDVERTKNKAAEQSAADDE